MLYRLDPCEHGECMLLFCAKKRLKICVKIIENLDLKDATMFIVDSTSCRRSVHYIKCLELRNDHSLVSPTVHCRHICTYYFTANLIIDTMA